MPRPGANSSPSFIIIHSLQRLSLSFCFLLNFGALFPFPSVEVVHHDIYIHLLIAPPPTLPTYA